MSSTNTPTEPTPNHAAAAQAAVTGATKSGKPSKVARQVAYQALITGLQGLYQPGDLFVLKDGTYTRDQLVTELARVVTAAEATKTANQGWRRAVQAEHDVELRARPLRQGVHAVLEARFGKTGAQLAQFGFVPSKTVKKAAVTKAAAVQKSRATRTARGTLGKVQKKAVKGILPPTVADAVTLLAARPKGGAPEPAPHAAPAPAAPAAAPGPKAS